MNYQKLGAELAMAIADVENPEEKSMAVFIQTLPSLDRRAIALLESLDVNNPSANPGIFTANLSINEVLELSDQAWVTSIQLSQKLRPI